MEQQQRSEQALMELQRRKQGEMQRRRPVTAGQALGRVIGAHTTQPTPAASSKRQAGRPAEDFVDLCDSGSDSDTGYDGSPQPSSHRSKRARLDPEAAAAAEEQSQQAALDAAATLPTRKAAALTAAAARACGAGTHGSTVAEQGRRHKAGAGAGAGQPAASGSGWSLGIRDGTASAGSRGATAAVGTADSCSQGPSGANPFTAPAQYVPAGGWESVADVDLYTGGRGVGRGQNWVCLACHCLLSMAQSALGHGVCHLEDFCQPSTQARCSQVCQTGHGGRGPGRCNHFSGRPVSCLAMPSMQQGLDAVSLKLDPGAADMYVDVLDIGMTRHRASACLDTGMPIWRQACPQHAYSLCHRLTPTSSCREWGLHAHSVGLCTCSGAL